MSTGRNTLLFGAALAATAAAVAVDTYQNPVPPAPVAIAGARVAGSAPCAAGAVSAAPCAAGAPVVKKAAPAAPLAKPQKKAPPPPAVKPE